jgi:CRP-like cAMP-binding protein
MPNTAREIARRFKGADGPRLLRYVLRNQSILENNEEAIEAVASRAFIKAFEPSETIFAQGGTDSDMLFILSGSVVVTKNGAEVERRSAGTIVGEVGAIDPSTIRSVTIKADEPTVAACVAEVDFTTIANTFPFLWRRVAWEIADRLRRRIAADSDAYATGKHIVKDYITIFAIMPFDDRYKKLELAIRRVLEGPPYCFQVRLARDYQFAGELLPNVRAHMAYSDGYIAEISDLSPNVMFELGAVMNSGVDRPVFPLRRSESSPVVPADIRASLYLSYSSLECSVEQLENEIRSHFTRDGRPVHSEISDLIAKRKNHFLSRILLEGIGIGLSETQRNSVLQRYMTIQAFLADTTGQISSLTGIPESCVIALRGALQSIIGTTSVDTT